MTLDQWLSHYKALPGYRVCVEEDGSYSAWMVYNEAGELVDWWWLSDAEKVRPIDDPFTPPPASFTDG